MKWLSVLFFNFLFFACFAQDEYKKCNYHYFGRSNSVSTKICFDAENRNGYAIAFNRQGKEIYRKGLRRYAGHASVHFTHYENGAVRSAEFSDAPDGGIQWHKEKTLFDINGNVTDVQTQGHEDMISPLQQPNKYPIEKFPLPDAPYTKPQVQEPSLHSEGVQVYVNEVWITNKSIRRIKVTAVNKIAKGQHNTITLNVGEIKKIIVYGNAINEQEVNKYLDFTILAYNPSMKKKKYYTYPFSMMQSHIDRSPYCSRHYYVIK